MSRRFKKRRFKDRKNTFGRFNYMLKTARNALRTARTVKSLLNVEYKYIDLLQNGVNIPNTGVIFCLSAMAEGDTPTTRDGVSVLAKYLYLKGYIDQHSDAGRTTVRFILFKMPQKWDNITPTVITLLNSAIPVDMINRNAGKRYKVLVDKIYTFADDGVSNRSFKIFKKFKKMHLKFNGAGGAETDTRDNAIYLMVLSDEASNVPTIHFSSRIRFIDN